MYAIIEACGKQYKVLEGDTIFFEKLDVEEGKKVTFDKVILLSNDKDIKIGNPYVKDVKVEGKVLSHGKGKKIIVFKMKPKKNERTKQGHRQPYTKVEITSIKLAAGKEEKTETKPVVKTENKKAEAKTTAEKTTSAKTTAKTTATKKATTKTTTKTATKKEETK